MLSPLLARVLVLSLVSASITHADATPTTIPLPIPHLTETTLLQVFRSVQGGPLTEFLTCDVATTRGLAQLTTWIQRERTAQRITSDELATAVPPGHSTPGMPHATSAESPSGSRSRFCPALHTIALPLTSPTDSCSRRPSLDEHAIILTLTFLPDTHTTWSQGGCAADADCTL